MAKKKTPKMPKTIYVYEEADGSETYMVACYERDAAIEDEQRRLVGTYQLVEVGELKRESVYRKL